MTQQVVYLGHRISKEGLEPTDNKVRAVREFPTPHNVAKLRLGMLSYYSKFLLDMSTTLAPLYALLQKNTPWRGCSSQRRAFASAKEAIPSGLLRPRQGPNTDG